MNNHIVKISSGIILLLLSSLSTAEQASQPPFLGKLHGTGRACSGVFIVGRKMLTWDTAFSQCVHSPYEIIKQEKVDGNTRVVYRLKSRGRKCLYPIIELSQTADQAIPGWDLGGFTSEEAWKKSDVSNVLSCHVM
jgi:hypothetical protein